LGKKGEDEGRKRSRAASSIFRALAGVAGQQARSCETSFSVDVMRNRSRFLTHFGIKERMKAISAALSNSDLSAIETYISFSSSKERAGVGSV
jgi:hypothetical protein